MRYAITNHTHDGANVHVAGSLSYIGPGAVVEMDLEPEDAASLPTSFFDVAPQGAATPSTSPVTVTEAAPAADSATEAPEAPTEHVEPVSNVGS